ncbi:hypothetical protein [uncultured Serinicoccus sp.]|uniref:hypothetical protein n=1 Tax=uncultured Serinicoccus sp. TaxID=735514 RepID=UPI00262444C2|nr:hypothetical protein [uncultured Serinicoccus sp.]
MSYSQEEALAALRPLLVGRDVADGFRLVEVRPQGPDVVVLFHWRGNRHVFGVVIPWSPHVGRSTGEPIGSAEEWATEVSWWLTEELDTGYVGRAQRRREPDFIELHGPSYEPDHRYYVSRVYGDGGWLAQCGWDVSVARTLGGRGLLTAWLQAHVNSASGGSVVGQAVVGRLANGDAELAVLDLARNVPDSVARDLATVCVDEAGNHGAERLRVDTTQSRLLTGMGFQPADQDSAWIDTTALNIRT